MRNVRDGRRGGVDCLAPCNMVNTVYFMFLSSQIL